jgi:hypothetical protein
MATAGRHVLVISAHIVGMYGLVLVVGDGSTAPGRRSWAGSWSWAFDDPDGVDLERRCIFALFGLGLGWAFSYVAATSELVDRAALSSVAGSSGSPISFPGSRALRSLSWRRRYNDIGVEAIAVGAPVAVALPAVVITLAHRRPPAGAPSLPVDLLAYSPGRAWIT